MRAETSGTGTIEKYLSLDSGLISITVNVDLFRLKGPEKQLVETLVTAVQEYEKETGQDVEAQMDADT